MRRARERRSFQLAARVGAEDHDLLVERIVHGQDHEIGTLQERQSSHLSRPEQLDALIPGEVLERRGRGGRFHASQDSGPATTALPPDLAG